VKNAPHRSAPEKSTMITETQITFQKTRASITVLFYAEPAMISKLTQGIGRLLRSLGVPANVTVAYAAEADKVSEAGANSTGPGSGEALGGLKKSSA